MNSKVLAPVICVFVIGGVIILNMPIPSETHTYTGTLIFYEPHDLLHGGYLLSSTVLHFSDGAAFTVDGAGVYAIESRYAITYEQAGSLRKVTLVTGAPESPQNNQTTTAYHILLTVYGMKDTVLRITHDPHVVGTEAMYLINSAYLEIQTEQEYTSKVFIAFYWPNYTMVNSFQMNVQPSYIFRYNQTSHMVEVD
jgi:hypothetical protein